MTPEAMGVYVSKRMDAYSKEFLVMGPDSGSRGQLIHHDYRYSPYPQNHN